MPTIYESRPPTICLASHEHLQYLYLIAVLRSRNVLFVVGAGSCLSWITSSAPMAAEVLSADCGRDIEAEAMAGSNGSEVGINAACVLRFLGTGTSSNWVILPLLDPLLGVFCMLSAAGTPDSGTFSSAVDAFSTVADFPFALVIGLGFGIDLGAVGIVVDSLLVI